MQPYTTKQGDTWDSIAYVKYGNELLAHLIMQANPEYVNKDVFIFSAGVVLNIPDNPNSAFTTQLPPWERPEPLLSLPDEVTAILVNSGVMASRQHGDLEGRNEPNQHDAAAVAYGKGSVDTALQGIEARMVEKEPYIKDFPASMAWIVEHGLGKKKPEYRLADPAGIEVVGSINWNEATEECFTVRFLMPVAGRAEVWI